MLHYFAIVPILTRNQLTCLAAESEDASYCTYPIESVAHRLQDMLSQDEGIRNSQIRYN